MSLQSLTGERTRLPSFMPKMSSHWSTQHFHDEEQRGPRSLSWIDVDHSARNQDRLLCKDHFLKHGDMVAKDRFVGWYYGAGRLCFNTDILLGAVATGEAQKKLLANPRRATWYKETHIADNPRNDEFAENPCMRSSTVSQIELEKKAFDSWYDLFLPAGRSLCNAPW